MKPVLDGFRLCKEHQGTIELFFLSYLLVMVQSILPCSLTEAEVNKMSNKILLATVENCKDAAIETSKVSHDIILETLNIDMFKDMPEIFTQISALQEAKSSRLKYVDTEFAGALLCEVTIISATGNHQEGTQMAHLS